MPTVTYGTTHLSMSRPRRPFSPADRFTGWPRGNCVLATAAVCFVCIVSGCLAPAVIATAGLAVAQEGASAYIGGELVTAVTYPLEQVINASRDALAELEFEPRVDRDGEHTHYFLVREVNQREIGVKLESASPQVTRIKVRVGVWGDQAVSQVIQNRIAAKLSPPPTTPG